MKERVHTLVLDASNPHWKTVAADTVLQGVLRMQSYDAVPERLRRTRALRGLGRFRLSYLDDWRAALCESPDLAVQVCNISNLVQYAACLRTVRDFDLIVVLHNAAASDLSLLLKGARRLRGRRGKLAVFIGNEYDVMADKKKFLRTAQADYVCSQLPLESARWLYADCAGTEVIPMPHALNPDRYRPPENGAERPLDVGFRGWLYRLFIGDVERTVLIRTLIETGQRAGLNCEFHEGTTPASEWVDFLRRCKATVGAESGSRYLDRQGELVSAAKAYEEAHPEAEFEEIFERFFAEPSVDFVSGKCISSRHFEAIGTKTCQILLEGDYNSILEPDVHYISVGRDLSNIEGALARFAEDEYRQAIMDRAHEHVMGGHTYAHRVQALVGATGFA